MKNIICRAAVLIAVLVGFLCPGGAAAQQLISPRGSKDVFPGQSVDVSVTGVIANHEYCLVNEDGSEMTYLSASGDRATCSLALPDGQYSVIDTDGDWVSEVFTISTYEIFRYVYPELPQVVSIPAEGGTLRQSISRFIDPSDGNEYTLDYLDAWYEMYTILNEWNAGAMHNRGWNPRFQFTVECDEGENSVNLIISADANKGTDTQSAILGLKGQNSSVVTLSQAPCGESGTQHDTLSAIFQTDLPANESWIETRYYNGSSYSRSIQHYNGLGYLTQEISCAYGVGDDGQMMDVVTPHSYDALGRENRNWLPFAGDCVTESYFNNSSPVNAQQSYYQSKFGHRNSFSGTQREASLSGRALSSHLPGENYQLPEHQTHYEYVLNEISDGLIELRATDNGSPMTAIGKYPAGALSGTRQRDADGSVSIVWKDGLGRTIAEDRISYPILARTQYVYNGLGELSWVVTPEGMSRISSDFGRVSSYDLGSDFADDWCYVYRYDGLGRTIFKKIPGSEAITYTYDDAGRMTSMQDGKLRAQGAEMLYTYDALGRLTCKYTEQEGCPSALAEYRYNEAGLLQTEIFYLLENNGAANQEYSLFRNYQYDEYERPVVISECYNPDGDSLITSFTYNYQGSVLTKTEKALVRGKQTIVTTTYAYDSWNRPIRETVSLNGSQVSTVEYACDELGRQSSTLLGEGTDAIAQRMNYSIQGWVDSIHSDLLDLDYHFEDSENPSWTGQISQMDWKHKSANQESPSQCNQIVRTLLHYDGFGRLIGSERLHNNGQCSKQFTERNIHYDLNGSMLSLERFADSETAPIDRLSFSYDGPKREGYSYDPNGNISHDPLRNLEITYNLLNLPCEIRSLNDDPDLVDLSYQRHFWGDGTLAAEITDGTRYESRQIGSLIYSGEIGSETPSCIVTSHGIVDCSQGSIPQMKYFLRDHLGSVRVVASSKDSVINRVDYYPYGAKINDNGHSSLQSGEHQRFGFSGKPYLQLGGLTYGSSISQMPYQHFGARDYDPYTATWLAVDPMAESFYDHTPYNYCAGNPVMHVDQDGRIPDIIWDVLSVTSDIKSLAVSIGQGDGLAIATDITALGADIVAAIIPGVPALGAVTTTTIRVGKTSSKVVYDVPTFLDYFIKGSKNPQPKGWKFGSYEIKYESGKFYIGKGSPDRMKTSARQHCYDKNKNIVDNVESMEWKASSNDRNAYIDEAKRIEDKGVDVKDPLFYNQRNSPGKTYIEQDKLK